MINSFIQSQLSHIYKDTIFFKKMGQPRSFSFIFVFFKQTLHLSKQINCEKCPSSIRHPDSNSQSSNDKSTLLTTRPGLQSFKDTILAGFNLSIVGILDSLSLGRGLPSYFQIPEIFSGFFLTNTSNGNYTCQDYSVDSSVQQSGRRC